PRSSAPIGFTEFGGDLYFRAATEETGRELYRIEAGSSIPTLVADINPGPGWSEPSGFFVL
uniref:hypothetical protein n=1 Tax=Microvirga aerophila TaxID=670291 RepID=UPI001AECDD06